MWYNTSQLSLLQKECGVIKPLYRKKRNVILKSWFALNTYHMLRNEFPVCSSVSKHGEDLTSKKLTTAILFWKWTLLGSRHLFTFPGVQNHYILWEMSECKACFFFLWQKSGNQGPLLCSHKNKRSFCKSKYYFRSFSNMVSTIKSFWLYRLSYNPVGVLTMPEVS